MNKINSLVACDCCGEIAATESFEEMAFEYGVGADAVMLNAKVPVFICAACGMEYTDSRAEQIRHDAVCAHLDVLNPVQVRNVREKHSLTVQVFSAISGLGTASINRWENAQLIQGKSIDRYLRLLEDPRNIQALVDIDHNVDIKRPTFRALVVNDQLQHRAASFCL